MNAETVTEFRIEWRSKKAAPWVRWIVWGAPVWTDRHEAEVFCFTKRSRYRDNEFRLAERTVTSTDWTPTIDEEVNP